ncbi:MAG: response regulator transcription factor [Spirochaetales bacterium]|jgi:DNA-binding NarL/FixJ family response regulator|nr:response regulator transcription factor [Spirochaetales bacterium]
MINVAIADDLHLFSESLKFVLEAAGEGKIVVSGIAKNGKEAIQLVSKVKPDVILMDIRMPVMDGVEATKFIHQHYPDTKVLILTTFIDDDLVVGALSNGATGYVLKDVGPEDLILSIEAVAKGAYYIAPSVGVRLVQRASVDDDNEDLKMEAAIGKVVVSWPNLTSREAQIAYYTARALTNSEIAQKLSISTNTVKNHLSSVFDKLKIHSRLQVIALVGPVLQSDIHPPSE